MPTATAVSAWTEELVCGLRAAQEQSIERRRASIRGRRMRRQNNVTTARVNKEFRRNTIRSSTECFKEETSFPYVLMQIRTYGRTLTFLLFRNKQIVQNGAKAEACALYGLHVFISILRSYGTWTRDHVLLSSQRQNCVFNYYLPGGIDLARFHAARDADGGSMFRLTYNPESFPGATMTIPSEDLEDREEEEEKMRRFSLFFPPESGPGPGPDGDFTDGRDPGSGPGPGGDDNDDFMDGKGQGCGPCVAIRAVAVSTLVSQAQQRKNVKATLFLGGNGNILGGRDRKTAELALDILERAVAPFPYGVDIFEMTGPERTLHRVAEYYRQYGVHNVMTASIVASKESGEKARARIESARAPPLDFLPSVDKESWVRTCTRVKRSIDAQSAPAPAPTGKRKREDDDDNVASVLFVPKGTGFAVQAGVVAKQNLSSSVAHGSRGVVEVAPDQPRPKRNRRI